MFQKPNYESLSTSSKNRGDNLLPSPSKALEDKTYPSPIKALLLFEFYILHFLHWG